MSNKYNPFTKTAASGPRSRKDEQFLDDSGQFNPRPMGARESGQAQLAQARNSKSAAAGRMYNAQGELNAWDRKDAAHQLGHLAGVSMQRGAGVARRAAVEDRERMRRVIQAAMMEPSGQGLHMIGQELALPIKQILDYEGWTRKILRTRSLGQAELFRLPMDVRATAFVIGQDGQTLESRMRSRYITPPEFKIASFVTVDIEDIYQVNYDILERAQDTARQSIELEEDKRTVSLLDEASTYVNSVTSFATVGVASLEALRVQIERHRIRADKFLFNRLDVSDVVTVMASSLDPVSQREANLNGYFGQFLGCQVLTSAGTQIEEVVPSGTIYCVAEPNMLGEFGIRIELFSDPYNKYGWGETVKGWAFVEMVGMVIGNVKSVAKAVRA